MSIFLLKDKANNEFLLQANDFEQALKAYPKLNCVFELKSIELMKAPLYITDVQDLHAYTTPKDGRVIDKEYVRKSGTYLRLKWQEKTKSLFIQCWTISRLLLFSISKEK